jgi:hypothetical protein
LWRSLAALLEDEKPQEESSCSIPVILDQLQTVESPNMWNSPSWTKLTHSWPLIYQWGEMKLEEWTGWPIDLWMISAIEAQYWVLIRFIIHQYSTFSTRVKKQSPDRDRYNHLYCHDFVAYYTSVSLWFNQPSKGSEEIRERSQTLWYFLSPGVIQCLTWKKNLFLPRTNSLTKPLFLPFLQIY